MTDKIVYIVTDRGVHGLVYERVIFASFDEQERNAWYDANPNRNYYSKSKRIVEIEKEINNALRKLDGIERLMLNIEQRPPERK